MRINPNKIIDKDVLFSLEKELNKDKRILERLITNLSKRISIANKHEKDRGKMSKEEFDKIMSLNKYYKDSQFLEGELQSLEWAIKDLRKVSDKLTDFPIKDGMPQGEIRDTAKLLRDMKSYADAYAGPISTILGDFANDVIEINKKPESERTEEDILRLQLYGLAKSVNNEITTLTAQYITLSRPLLEQLIKPFFGERREVKLGEDVLLDEIMRKASQDIHFLDRWIYSLSNSNSPLLRVMDQVARSKKDNARMTTIDDSKDLLNAHMEYEKATGSNDTSFVLEVDDDGQFTGDFKKDRDYVRYNKDLEDYSKDINNRYKDSSPEEYAIKIKLYNQ